MQLGILRSELINEVMRLKIFMLRMLDRLGAVVSMFGLWWADPVTGLIVVVFLVREGRETIAGSDD